MYKFDGFDDAEIVRLAVYKNGKRVKDKVVNLYEVSPDEFVDIMALIPESEVTKELAYVINDVIKDKVEYSRESFRSVTMMRIAGRSLIGKAVRKRLALRADEAINKTQLKTLSGNDDIMYHDTVIYLDVNNNNEVTEIEAYFEAFDEIVYNTSINKLNEKEQIGLLSLMSPKVISDPKLLEAFSKDELTTSAWSNVVGAGDESSIGFYHRDVDMQAVMDNMKNLKPNLYNYVCDRILAGPEPGSDE